MRKGEEMKGKERRSRVEVRGGENGREKREGRRGEEEEQGEEEGCSA